MLRTVVGLGTWGIPHANVMDTKRTLVGLKRKQKHSASRQREPLAIKAHFQTRTGGGWCHFSHPDVWRLVAPAPGPTSLSPARPAVRGTGHPQTPARWLGTKLPLRVVTQTRNPHSRSISSEEIQNFFNAFHRWRTLRAARAAAATGTGLQPPVVHRCGGWQVETPALVPNSNGPGGKKNMEKPAPHPGEQAQRLCAMGKSNRAGLLFYFFASWFLLTTLTFGVRSFLAAAGARRDPCPRRSREGPALLPAHPQD